ncbi:MAG TPA: hypothetical protein VFZ51_07435 [Woeseiaceae bacterium]
MNQRYGWLICAAALSACASTPPTPPEPAGTLLAYEATAPATYTYAFSDTSGFSIEGGAIGNIKATITGAGTAELQYAPAAGGIDLTVTLTDFAGTFTNTAAGGMTNATEADVQGQARLHVDRQGVLTVASLPTASRAAQAVGVGASFFRRFTLRLPGTLARPGASWTDTVAVNEETGGTRAAVRDIVHSTWARDTIVGGRTLNVITHATQRTLDITGTSEGVEIAQHLTGTARGVTLWDAARNVIVERTETTDLSGTFDLPAMGISGLPVTAAGSGRISLRE